MTLSGVDLLYQAAEQLWPQPVRTFTAAPVVPAEDRDDSYMHRASAWCHKSLQGYVSHLAAMQPDTGRNHYLNAAGWRMYRFALAGHLEADEITIALRDAALECGLGNGEIEGTLASSNRAALRDGALEPPVRSGDGPAPDPFDALSIEVDVETGEVKPPAPSAEEAAQRRHDAAVRFELANLRARDEAKRLYTAEQAARTFREPPSVLTLREQLLLPREPVRYSITELLPRGGNALLTAQFKAGKTTLLSSLLRSYADGLPFLGRFDVTPHPGRIAIFNYELGQQQYDEWLEQSGIVNQERISVLHLRGYRLDLRSPTVEDWIVEWLKDHDVNAWIADPFARAAVGVDENSNTEVGVWLDTFDVIKERAGVIDGVLSTHTGRAEQEHGQERARGATRLDDWADVRWLLTKNDEGDRFFRATGRDVEIAEEMLSFDSQTRSLTMSGGDRQWVSKRRLEDLVVAFVAQNPGCNVRAIVQGVEGAGAAVQQAARTAVVGHRIRVEEGHKGALLHWSNGA